MSGKGRTPTRRPTPPSPLAGLPIPKRRPRPTLRSRGGAAMATMVIIRYDHMAKKTRMFWLRRYHRTFLRRGHSNTNKNRNNDSNNIKGARIIVGDGDRGMLSQTRSMATSLPKTSPKLSGKFRTMRLTAEAARRVEEARPPLCSRRGRNRYWPDRLRRPNSCSW